MSKNHSRLSFLKAKSLHPDYPLFVFLPGMDGTGKLLHAQTISLEKYFDVRCLAIPPNDLNDWDTLSTEVIKLIEAVLEKKTSRQVYLCGESFGGCLALKVAVKIPKLFQRLILINPASSFNQRPWLSWGINITQGMPEFLHQRSSLVLLPFLAALNRITPSDRRALLNAMQSVPPEVASWRISLLRDFVLDDRDLRRLTQPVLLIASGSDRLLPSVEEAQRLRKILPHAKMTILPESGHAPLIEEDLQLYNLLKEQQFLEAVKLKS